jgi:GGDEF domain-containing protein
MNQDNRFSALFTALSSLLSLFAGVGIWFVIEPTVSASVPAWVIIPVAALVVAIVLMFMLRVSAHHAHDAGVASAQLDVATRLPSQAIARQLLMREFAAAERGRDLSVTLFCFDNLPRLMISRPHEASRVLLSVGTILKRRTRGMNLSARLNDGHTFISVLGGVDEFGAQTFVGKVIKDLSALLVAGQPVNVRTAVCGYDAIMQSVDDLLAKAHASLIERSVDEEGRLIA